MEGCDCGNMGGAGFPMNNGFNTNGIGDPVCPGSDSYGSGDLFYGGFSGSGFGYPATKKGVNGTGKKKKNNMTVPTSRTDSYTQFGYGSITHGGTDMSPRPLYVPFGKK